MKLEEISSDPYKALIYLERYVNDGSPSGFSQNNSMAKEFIPDSSNPYFYLPVSLINKSNAEILSANPSINFEFTKQDKIKFILHPETNKTLDLPIDHYLKAAPSSSSRTVFLLDFPEAMVKLHYAGMIGRAPRKINRETIEESVHLSKFLDSIFSHKTEDKVYESYGYLPESIGILNKKLNCGFIIRELKARPLIHASNILIPSFSLFGIDKNNKKDKKLLIQLIEKQKENELTTFCNIIELYLESYINMALTQGVVGEEQAQNTLIQVDNTYKPLRVIRRDFYDFYVDQDIRSHNGLSILDKVQPLEKKRKGEEVYYGKHSFLFDFKLCEYVIDPLCKTFSECYDLNLETLQKEIKNLTWKTVEKLGKIKEFEEYFKPWNTIHYFKPKAKIYETDGIPLFDKKEGVIYR